MLNIQREEPGDYELVENITRDAFYNLYIPGCVEHYLVHTMRSHEDFIPELDFVLELNNEVIGYIMYTKATLTDEAGNVKTILTMLVRELKPDALDGRKWYYKDSPVMTVLPENANAYDDTLIPKERKHTPTQEEFYIMSHSFVE